MARYCKNCGNPLDENANFCTACGTQQDPVPEQDMAYQPAENGQPVAPPPMPGSAPKSKLVAGLLGIFLGGWGIHNFYLGNTQRGVIQIIVSICTCGIGGLWGFIEGILILCGNINTDADGNYLSD